MDGAGITKIDLVDALDSEKWQLLPHFMETTFEDGGDTARVLDTDEQHGNLTGVRAVLTMSGQ